jgi:hypothetical protein
MVQRLTSRVIWWNSQTPKLLQGHENAREERAEPGTSEFCPQALRFRSSFSNVFSARISAKKIRRESFVEMDWTRSPFDMHKAPRSSASWLGSQFDTSSLLSCVNLRRIAPYNNIYYSHALAKPCRGSFQAPGIPQLCSRLKYTHPHESHAGEAARRIRLSARVRPLAQTIRGDPSSDVV